MGIVLPTGCACATKNPLEDIIALCHSLYWITIRSRHETCTQLCLCNSEGGPRIVSGLSFHVLLLSHLKRFFRCGNEVNAE